MATAKHARDQGKLLYAVDWRGENELSEGNRALLDEGAIAVRGPQDVAEIRLALADRIKALQDAPSPSPRQPSLFDT